MKRSAPHRTGRLRPAAWAAAVLLVAAGCTICPDPFDYSGPVPDGSPPQNDFHARANGIAPMGNVPRPWPPVVRVVPETDDTAHVVVAAVEETAEEAPEEPVEDSVADPAAGAPEEGGAAVRTAAEETASDGPVEPTAPRSVVEEPTLEEVLPPAPRPRPEILPPLRETPGWRPRG